MPTSNKDEQSPGKELYQLTDRIVNVLEEFHTVIGLVKDNTKDIEVVSARAQETEKRASALFRTVFEGPESIVSQVMMIRSALEKMSDEFSENKQTKKEMDARTQQMVGWYEYHKDELKQVTGAAEWIANQKERERLGAIEPMSKRMATIVGIVGGIAGIIAFVISVLSIIRAFK